MPLKLISIRYHRLRLILHMKYQFELILPFVKFYLPLHFNDFNFEYLYLLKFREFLDEI